MSTAETAPSEYLLLFRGTEWRQSCSPAELQKSMAGFIGWFEKLNAEGILKAGQPLMDESRVISGQGGRTVADGPYAESKEAVGGYFLIRAESFDAAVAIARQCPLLDLGSAVEVRPIAAICPMFQRTEQLAASLSEPAGI
jgi:hypothetical protein